MIFFLTSIFFISMYSSNTCPLGDRSRTLLNQPWIIKSRIGYCEKLLGYFETDTAIMHNKIQIELNWFIQIDYA